MKKFLVLILSSSMLFTACSKGDDKKLDIADLDGPEMIEVAKVPEGCPQINSLTAESKEAGTAKFKAADSWFMSWGPDSGTFYFMNYSDFEPKNYSAHKVVGKDVKASFDLKTVDKSALKKGVWNYRKDKENNKLDWLNISTEKLAGGVFDDNGKVEITYFGDDYVCGNVTAKDSSSSLNGAFMAKFYKWK